MVLKKIQETSNVPEHFKGLGTTEKVKNIKNNNYYET